MWGKSARRDELLSEPFPEGWESYLQDNLFHFRLLSSDQRLRLKNDLRILVAEKYWEGCGGLQITEEMKVIISGQASLLLLGLQHDYFARVKSVLVYPSTFVIPGGEWMDELEWREAADGQAVYRGPVILSWDAVLAEGRAPSIGENLVIHEFAHHLDYLDGEANGTPPLGSTEQSARWHEVMTAEYRNLQRKVDKGRGTFLGDYAASDEGEFFAVASERFFTLPDRLNHLHPRLFQLLRDYYGVNPLTWFSLPAKQ